MTCHPPIAAYLRSHFNHVFAVLISLARFDSVNFYQTRPKIVIFAKELKNLQPLGLRPLSPPGLLASGGPPSG